MSRILVDQVRSNSASGDAITLDGNGKCAINATTINSLTFPTSDGSANQLIKTDGSGALSFVTATSGLADFDMWYLTANHSGNTNPIQNNWSRWTQYGGEGSVTFSAPSSGIWTFPSTGYWKIDFTVYNQSDGNNSERGCNTNMYVTTNNSSYLFVGESATNLHKADDNSNISKGYTMLSYIFDVTDTSTHKCKFSNGYNQRAGTVIGHGAYLYTHVKFMKLKET